MSGHSPKVRALQFCLLTSRQGSGDQIFLGLPQDPLARSLTECVKLKEDSGTKACLRPGFLVSGLSDEVCGVETKEHGLTILIALFINHHVVLQFFKTHNGVVVTKW